MQLTQEMKDAIREYEEGWMDRISLPHSFERFGRVVIPLEYTEPILSERDKVDSSGVVIDSRPISDERCEGLHNTNGK